MQQPFRAYALTNSDKHKFAHDMAMAYMSQQDVSGLSPTEYLEKFQDARKEIYEQIKHLNNPYAL